METARRFYSNICHFCQSVVEWKSPATGPYLLAVNSLFWLSAFYCEHILQMRMLISIAVGVLSWDILLSSSNDNNIAVHLVMWPVRSLFRTAAVVLSFYSWNLLRLQEIEAACWAAYGTVGCLLINPVWRANHVNEKLSDGAKYIGTAIGNGVNRFIISPARAIFNAFIYVVTFQFIPPLWNLFKGGLGNAYRTILSSTKNAYYSVKQWWISCVVEPIYRGVSAVAGWLRYWFCAHWWPDLKAWMAVHIGEPCKRAFNYLCFCLVYVFCGHWLPPLGRFLKKYLEILGAFLYRTVLAPTKAFIWRKCDEFRCWLRAQLHRLAVALRDSVLWPICVLIVDISKELSYFVYRVALKPVLDYFYQRYKILETVALVYLLGPICKMFINNIPEKNPFCEESDVELDGMLPSEMSDIDDEVVNNENPSEDDFLPRTPLEDRSLTNWTLSPYGHSLTEEERDFAAGLDFPDVDQSESSDEEFDLKTKTKRTVRHRRPNPLKTSKITGGYDDTFEELR